MKVSFLWLFFGLDTTRETPYDKANEDFLVRGKKEKFIWIFLRLGMGWIFFWPFLDKLFGLGFATPIGKSWLSGSSPTFGFLKFGTHGPFATFFQNLAGSAFVDWLFMIGLLLIGLALILGIGVRIASFSGALILFLMWLSALPPEHNPFLDDHLIYLVILLGLTTTRSGQWFGLGKWWLGKKLVKKYPILE